jgi:hypothetical protein
MSCSLQLFAYLGTIMKVKFHESKWSTYFKLFFKLKNVNVLFKILNMLTSLKIYFIYLIIV